MSAFGFSSPFLLDTSPQQMPYSLPTKEKSQLWMGELDPWWDENTIRLIWLLLGETVVGVKLIKEKSMDGLAGYNAGYCFVDFGTYAAASKAVLKNGLLIPGTNKALKLNWAAGSSAPAAGFGAPALGVPANESLIFVGDLANEVAEQELYELFRLRYPSVTNTKIMMDPLTGTLRGYGFIRFALEAEQQRALVEMNGVVVGGRPLRVSTAVPKNSAPAYGSSGSPASQYLDPNNTTVFVGGLSNGVLEQQLRLFFQPFGDIIYVKVLNNKGCGFVQYVLRLSAESAIQQMQGYPIGNLRIRLSWGRLSAQNSQNQQKYLQQMAAPSLYTPFGQDMGLQNGLQGGLQGSLQGGLQGIQGVGLAAPAGITPMAQFGMQLDQERLKTLLNAARDGRLDRVETGLNGFIYA